MATAELRLLLPLDRARDAVASTLVEQGFSVQPTASGSLDVSRGSLGTTIVAGAFAGQDMHVRFDVHFTEDAGSTLAAFEHSTVGGFFKGGAVGAAKAGDVVREAAHLSGVRLAQQGLLQGAVPDGAPAPTPDVDATDAIPAGPFADDAGAAAQGYPAPTAPPADYAAVPPGVRYGAPAPVPGAGPRTNTVAIIALVLGFVVPIGGIVAGSVALAQVKRTGEKGRGLAIGGIVVGAVMSVLSILGAIALFALFAFGAASSSGASSPMDPFVPPSEQAPAEPDESFALPVGSCLDDVASGFITSDNVLDCAQPHTYEVFQSFLLDDGVFPGDAVLQTEALDRCGAQFDAFVGIAYADSTLDYSYVSPTEQTWAQGDRELLCLIFDPAGETTGSLAASQR
ncbi:MAG: hypothetical protein BGO45_07185 [Microbacterium sp. 71-36]|uniref:DUF4190 domain-containing protein n=1 Tax=unclassified Microbacterium TaxID=2609290 RepID=UPI00086989F1|nr:MULTISPECIES: DUF4190 domain-containing protein [unclassified Microbacterium]MBN9211562.1 DUF4190 domain-containing protein [Microbacterium sp.]ODT37767.1 MAG: hypothetical protein ABS60_12330 [Microbacterium sp. SCN 71-17]OJV75448.1 MAG: hypothetical protein BGO45_07185 [Microbacterium sp. 71-36]